jgi:hypothetical protein
MSKQAVVKKRKRHYRVKEEKTGVTEFLLGALLTTILVTAYLLGFNDGEITGRRRGYAKGLNDGALDPHYR